MLSFRYVIRDLFKAGLIVVLAILLDFMMSPDRALIVLSNALLFVQKDLVGFPLPLFSALSLAGFPTPLNASISTVQQGTFLIVECLLFGLAALTFIRGADNASRLTSIVPFGLFILLQILYLAAWIYYGASYQQWKFASSYPLVFGFTLLASCYAAFALSVSEPIRKYAHVAMTMILALGVFSNVYLSRDIWHGRVHHYPKSWQALSAIDEMPGVQRVIVGFADYAVRMASSVFIKHKTIVFDAPTHYGRGEPHGEISPTNLYLQKQPDPCAGASAVPLGPFVLLSERLGRIVPGRPVAFSEISTSCAALTGIAGAESWGRWTDGHLAKISFRCSCGADRPQWVVLRGTPFLGRQRVDLRVNGISSGSVTVTGNQPSDIRIPLSSVTDFDDVISVELSLPDAVAPTAIGSGDIRQLGLALVTLVVESGPILPASGESAKETIAPESGSAVATDVTVDEEWYLAEYPDVRAAIRAGRIKSAADHYRRYGYVEKRFRSKPIVDEEWYVQTYPDVAQAIREGREASAVDHFVKFGFREGRKPSPPDTKR